MTNQFKSEQDLFDQEQQREFLTPVKIKRNSFGPKLPISPPGNNSKAREMSEASGQQGGKRGKGGSSSVGGPSAGESSGSGRGGGGSVLGVAGFKVKTPGQTFFEGTDDLGKVVEFDAYNTVFPGAFPESGFLEKFLNYLEATGVSSEYAGFIEGVSYQGFDRELYIRAALLKVSVSVFCRFAILGAVRGSNFQKILESCLLMPQDLAMLISNGTVIKKAKKRDDLTILRFTASIPHWVCFWLFKVDYPKKIESLSCPGWLQFPGAASLPMSKSVRLQHIEFCKAFSSLLPGGIFNGNIYLTAFMNPIPLAHIPSMIKDRLEVGSTAGPTITSEEVRSQVTMQMVKT
jgi:hypothetical protein